MRYTYEPAHNETDLRGYADAVAWVFDWDRAETVRWVELHGLDMIRVVREGPAIVGGMMIMPLAKYFGGKPVPLAGVAAVVIHPEHRGRGAGGLLMREGLREMRERGFPISGLFPATLPVYRSAGYELAGERHTVTLTLRLMQLRPPARPQDDERGIEIRSMTDADLPEVKQMYERSAALHNGHLQRSDAIWNVKIFRLFLPTPAKRLVLTRNGVIEGLLCYTHHRRPGEPFDLMITDATFSTPAAARRALAFLADHGSIAGRAVWIGTPGWNVLSHLRERPWTSATAPTFRDHIMLRVIDPGATLQARGYPAELSAELAFTLRDEHIPANTGSWTLRVERGAGTCEPTLRPGVPAIELDTRALATLFSGYTSASVLASQGMLEGDALALRTADALFSGPTPWMQEIY